MKKTKKMAALALTMAMASTGMTAAYAEDPTASVSASTEVKSITKADGSMNGTDMTLTGTIKVTSLSVTIPTTVAFNVDMTQVPAASATEKAAVNVQVEQPGEDVYRIKNNSASAVWVYVTDVTPSAATAGKTPVLTDTYADVKDNNYNLLFAIKDAKAAAPAVNAYSQPDASDMTIGATSYWMKSGTPTGGKYYLNDTNGKLIAKDQATGADEGKNEMGLTIYAFTRKGWTAGDKFTVKPVFTVSVEDPNPPTP